jgi:methylation protein EvaC
LKKRKVRIAGYGASAKGTTLLNWCGIDVETVEFVADNTPAKQGKLIPGTSIPIVSPQHLHKYRPDFILLLAWNHFNEIKEREVKYTRDGGRWIRYLPDVRIL